MKDSLKIGLVQYSPAWENPAGSVEKIDKLLNTQNREFDLLVFPELTLTGFTFSSAKLAEDIDGISTTYFIKLAQKFNSDIMAGLIERDDENIYNCLIHIDKKGLIKAKYRKIHPFSFAGENKYFNSTKEPIITKIDDIKIGLSICYDLRFPELYRLYAKEKVDLLINIANWPQKRIEHWQLLTKARALENLAYFIGVNRVGKDPDNVYNGFSSIVSPLGELLNQYSSNEEIIYHVIDLNLLSTVRNKFSFLNDIKLI